MYTKDEDYNLLRAPSTDRYGDTIYDDNKTISDSNASILIDKSNINLKHILKNTDPSISQFQGNKFAK